MSARKIHRDIICFASDIFITNLLWFLVANNEVYGVSKSTCNIVHVIYSTLTFDNIYWYTLRLLTTNLLIDLNTFGIFIPPMNVAVYVN